MIDEEVKKPQFIAPEQVVPFENLELNSLEHSILDFVLKYADGAIENIEDLFAIARANTQMSASKLVPFYHACCRHFAEILQSESQAAIHTDYTFLLMALLLCLEDTDENRFNLYNYSSGLFQRLNKFIFSGSSSSINCTAFFKKEPFIDFVCKNAHDTNHFYSYEQFVSDFEADDNTLKAAVQHVVQGGQFKFAGVTIQRYYADYIVRMIKAIENKYKDLNRGELERQFDNSLRYIGKRYEYRDVKTNNTSTPNYPPFIKLIKVLYKKIEPFVDDQLHREYKFTMLAYNAYGFYKSVACNLNDTLNLLNVLIRIEGEYREALEMEALSEPESINNIEIPANPIDANELFEKIINYAANRYQRSEMELIVNMLNRVCRGDADKLERVDLLEKEWNELHMPQNSISLQGAQIHQLNMQNGTQNTLPPIQEQS